MSAHRPHDDGTTSRVDAPNTDSPSTVDTVDVPTTVDAPTTRRLAQRFHARLGPFAVIAVVMVVVAAPWVVRAVAADSVTRPPLATTDLVVNPIDAVSLQPASAVTDISEVVPLHANFAKEGKVVWRPSTGEWSWTDPDGTALTYQWGQAGDIPVVGDYNGNAAVDDLAVWRPSNGTWYIWYDAGRGIKVSRQWGGPGDVPLVGDFNGNSRHDITVWRPSNGTWYIIYDGASPNQGGCQPVISNSGCPASFGWGLAGDIPVVGNFAGRFGGTSEGFGPDDLAIFRPGDGTWWIWYDGGTGTQLARGWGGNGDIPMPGGYSGYPYYSDDLAIYRPSTGTWWIWHNGGTNAPGPAEARAWGKPGDIPVRWGPIWELGGAFCGNTVNCPALYRPSDGSWQIAHPHEGTMVAVHSGFCLDVAGGSQADGGAIHQWGCHGGTNQLWRLSPVGDRTYLIVSVHSGKCLDVAGFSHDDGGAVHQWSCHGGNNQR